MNTLTMVDCHSCDATGADDRTSRREFLQCASLAIGVAALGFDPSSAAALAK